MAAHSAAKAAGRGSFVRKFCILKEMFKGSFDRILYCIVVGACLTDPFRRSFQRQDISGFVLDPCIIDVLREGLSKRVRDSLLFFGETASGRSQHPFVSRIRAVEVGNRAPAHGTKHIVGDAFYGSDRLEIRIIEGTVSC